MKLLCSLCNWLIYSAHIILITLLFFLLWRERNVTLIDWILNFAGTLCMLSLYSYDSVTIATERHFYPDLHIKNQRPSWQQAGMAFKLGLCSSSPLFYTPQPPVYVRIQAPWTPRQTVVLLVSPTALNSMPYTQYALYIICLRNEEPKQTSKHLFVQRNQMSINA